MDLNEPAQRAMLDEQSGQPERRIRRFVNAMPNGRHVGEDHMIFFQNGQQTIADYAAGAAAGSPT